MSDRFSIIPLKQLLSITLKGLKKKSSFFSINSELFFEPGKEDKFKQKLFDQFLDTPIGVAAGPHTQLAQNIVAAWLTGARFIELKTVQTLDELDVSKPCIDMQDEGYNCEWSQELKIRQSFDQYLNAWIIIHVLNDMFFGAKKELGTIFNMSVGYDYKGILQENVQWYLDKMSDASAELDKKINEIKDIYPNVVNLNISPCISDNITLSTMHGCPPEEIEQIGEYLITERKLHTAIKLNPTLLGEKKLREIIDNSGFDTKVPDIAFEHDLKYEDATGIIRRLSQKARENNVQFSLKLTNTLESENNKDVFSPDEKMMYASGRVLHPISINLAKKLQNEFNGQLNISFSGGADAFNITDIISSGLYPVTVCSDILKPGGYGRLGQYIENLRKGISQIDFEDKDKQWKYLQKYADKVLEDKRYKKNDYVDPSIKTHRKLDAFDCVHAPCVDYCPTNQDIPDYMYYTAKGDFDKAFEVITKTNPFPNTPGMVCDQPCQTKCTRIKYDSP
ncbi:MAG TPA: putative selenate reductase subunit YgfK, partial [Saprospiraceae bacterium]|nr:putative selenate reductase subunit YgfK [Saprospiraceae bacterium]